MPTNQLESEIDKAIDEVVEERAREDVEEKSEDKVVDQKPAEGVMDQGDAADEAEEVDIAGEETGKEEEVEADGAADAGKEISTPVTISDEALTRAVEVGIPLADARMFPSEGSLISAVNRMENAIQSVIETEEEEKPVDPFANFPKLDPEVYEPEVIQTLDKFKDIIKQQYETIQSLQSQHEEVSEVSQAQAAAEIEQWFDRQVAGLGKDFEEALGAGGYNSLDRGSSQFAKRDAIARQVSVLLAGYQAQGQQSPPWEEVFKVAAGQVLQDEYRQIHEKELRENLKKQASQHIQRAGGAKAKPKLSPEEEIAAEVDAKFFSR